VDFDTQLHYNHVVNFPGINETLALLDSLKGVAGDFAAREEKLNQEFVRSSNKELNSFESATGTVEFKLSQFSEQQEMAFNREQARRGEKLQARTIAINNAHAVARKQAERASDEHETQFNDSVRTNTTLAERRREEELAAETARFEHFQQQLADSGAALSQQEADALKGFGGFRKFRRWLAPGHPWPEPDFSAGESELLAESNRLAAKAGDDLKRFQKFIGPKMFRFVPVWLIGVVLLAAGVTPLIRQTGFHLIPPEAAYGCLAACVCVCVFYWVALRAAKPLAAEIAGDLSKARRLLDGCQDISAAHHAAEQQRIKEECESAIRALNRDWKQQVRELAGARMRRTQAVDDRASRAVKHNAEYHHAAMEAFKRQQAEALSLKRLESAAQIRKLTEVHQEKMAELKSRHQADWQVLEADWKKAIEPLWSAMREQHVTAEKLFPEWNGFPLENWTPPAAVQNAAKFARLEINLPVFAEKLPKDKRLAFPGQAQFSMPLALVFPQQGSILFETAQHGANEANAAISNLIFRLLSAAPPGKLSFTIFDPVGLGQNFASLMHLADYEESSINSRIWTQTAQFEEKLAELNEHMEKVIQMYLRNEYATIAEYNAQAGSVAEKYHFLVIASFPAGFSDTAARRLRNIAANGARCGVYTFIQWDARVAPPSEAGLEELRKNSLCLKHTERGFEFSGRKMTGMNLWLDAPPPAEFSTQFLHRAGKSSKDATRVEVPFATVAPADKEVWTEQTVEELRVPIGRSGATKLQYLAIGKGTRQHALLAGKTGSGKSTLFHVIITNLGLWCSPEQVEFYLVDFKKGVEFKCYASRKLPHARVVAIESDREFGLSVLQRVDDELRRRGDLFRKLGAQDLAGYNRAGGTEKIPRTLLMIDEFQEFFTEEDRVSQGAAVLLDRIVRQGRAFGIHVILGSQTLGGAYTLARATIGQMVIRVALQCNEADAYLIMDQDNPAPRLLSRPGEGIYNDAAGAIEGNSPFQAVWLSDRERDDQLARIRARADQAPGKYMGPIVFEGNAPADVLDNSLLNALLVSPDAQQRVPTTARAWLGAPNSIKGPTEVVFQRQSANNLLIVGQSEERALTSLAVAMISLAAQFPSGNARFVVLDSSAPGSPEQEFFQQVIRAIPHEVVQANNASLADVFGRLAEDLKQRNDEEQRSAPETFILIHGLQNFKKLRAEDEFSFSSSDTGGAPNPAAILGDLLREGPARGIHVLATCDTYNSVNRFLGRKMLSEFEARMLFQMSAADSASLIDDPAAGTLGFYRALLYQDREGTREVFRPYARPGRDWIETAAQHLAHPGKL
jgi:hypothetical protein